jgi:hypothetical protein
LALPCPAIARPCHGIAKRCTVAAGHGHALNCCVLCHGRAAAGRWLGCGTEMSGFGRRPADGPDGRPMAGLDPSAATSSSSSLPGHCPANARSPPPPCYCNCPVRARPAPDPCPRGPALAGVMT